MMLVIFESYWVFNLLSTVLGIVGASRHEFSAGAIKVEGGGQINSDFCFQGNYTLVGGHKKKVKQML